jgi:short subunit dehydrogenase-like uncharacterized protein
MLSAKRPPQGVAATITGEALETAVDGQQNIPAARAEVAALYSDNGTLQLGEDGAIAEALPDATHLVLAFEARGPMSPGTARTMARSLRPGQHGGRVRRNGVIEEMPLAQSWRRIDFASGSATAVAIAWGDLATAWFSTGIPNIETYAVAPRAVAMAGRALNWVRPFLASAPGQMLLTRLANRVSGPSQEHLRTARSRLWGEVRNAAGQRRTAHLETANGYRLTADGTIMAVQYLLTNTPSGGYYTPSMLLGRRCVEQLPGSTSIRVE